MTVGLRTIARRFVDGTGVQVRPLATQRAEHAANADIGTCNRYNHQGRMDKRKPKEAPAKTDETPRRLPKRRWRSPEIKTGHLFESNSLSCGKNTPGIDQCNNNPTQS